jgi:hypothetical protein
MLITSISVVGMRVREDGPVDGLPRIDVKITLLAIEASRRERDKAAAFHIFLY